MSATYKDYGYKTAEPSSAHSYLLKHLRVILGPTQGTILDLGCGNGAIARALITEGYDVYGVDASATGITIANAEIPGRFFVLDVSAGQLPTELASKNFDVVISTEVIEHLYDPRGFIAFARKILVNGGEFIVSTPYHGYFKSLALAITGKLDDHFTVLWDGGHIKFFSRKTLEQMLIEQGFEVIDFVGAGRVLFLWKSMLVKARVC
jgi:2-polyprenyl-3-methyl-5-hydroxy-6-metoxy-1,4-benzoquinol methylase